MLVAWGIDRCPRDAQLLCRGRLRGAPLCRRFLSGALPTRQDPPHETVRENRGRPHRHRTAGELSDPAKIRAVADRVLRSSPVGRCFEVTIKKGFFSWDFNEKARRYDEELLCGRYVITTSLNKEEAPAAQVLRYYRNLQAVEYWFSQVFLPALQAFPDLSSLFSTPPAA